MKLREFFLAEADWEEGEGEPLGKFQLLPKGSNRETSPNSVPGHSPYCVCHGKGWIWDVEHGSTPNGTNTPSQISGNVKIACPYGDLRVNQPGREMPPDDDGWDL